MDARLCPSCGSPLRPDAPACEVCGAPAPPPGDRSTRVVLWIVLAGVVAAVALGVGLFVVLSGDGDDANGSGEVFDQDSVESSTTTSSTTTNTPSSSTTTGPAVVPGDSYEAVNDWVVGMELNYVGLCDQLDSTLDYGADPWCAQLWEDRGTEVVFRVADFPGGDFGTWVLTAARPTGWTVVDDAEDTGSGPPF